MLYAAVIRISHAVAPVGSSDVVEDVWRYPEAYIGRIHACLVVLLFSASFAAGVLVWRRTRSLSAGVALQTGLILLAELAVSAGMIWPETVVIVIGVLFAGTLTLFILDDCSSPRLCVALGVLGALGIAAKVTFAIVTMAPAVLSRSRRQSILYFAVLIGCTGVLIAPILARIPQVIDFLAGLAYRTGDYGADSAGFDMRAYLYGAGLLVRQNKIPAAVILLSVAVLVTLRSTTVLHGPQRSQLRALCVLTLLELLTVRSGRPSAVPALPDSSRAPHGSQSRHHSANRIDGRAATARSSPGVLRTRSRIVLGGLAEEHCIGNRLQKIGHCRPPGDCRSSSESAK